MKLQITYSQQESGVPFPVDNRLEIYAYNGSQSDWNTDEVANTTFLEDEQRTAGDCDDSDPDISSLADELCSDDVDENCDGNYTSRFHTSFQTSSNFTPSICAIICDF